MDQRNNEKFILIVSTLLSVGLIIEIMIMGWEFWVVPIIIMGIYSLWTICLSERIDHVSRRYFYIGYSVIQLFYHGVHRSSLFDVSISIVIIMLIFSILNNVRTMSIFLGEYFLIMLLYLLNIPVGRLVLDRAEISRLLLHTELVLVAYYINVRMINERLDHEEENRIKEERVELNDAGMEDFLSNISHELRTPVNVVNGMSDLLIKRCMGFEADSIKSAGVRLAYQIEDIQDYTECKRGDIFLEEDSYMATSLINDVVTSFTLNENEDDLELVVDLDPDTPAVMRGDVKKLHKIFRHLLENAVKFTPEGGIYVKMYTEKADYGVNLCIEMTDTGIGMDTKAIQAISDGMYQANKKRDRSSGGIGLGLFIVYGFAHAMGGFVKIESEKRNGSTIRVTIPQKVVDPKPCLSLNRTFEGTALFHVRPDKYKIPKLRDFYRSMASNLASGTRVPLYAAETVYEVERLREKLNATHVFMGQEEYEENRGYFEELAKEDIIVAVSAGPGFSLPQDSRVVLMPKPLYAYHVIKIINEGRNASYKEGPKEMGRPVFAGVRALVVDDEPMNLIVASSIFRDYGMVIETAGSGFEAIRRCEDTDYDLVFMDHMMPQMDGVEAMKRIKEYGEEAGKSITVVALTANAVSGAREMFMKEGFDGFIAKPIDTDDFERVMLKVLPAEKVSYDGRDAG
ncbi:MAG: response regulator [Lachnospiraceae bacterium]|nr:response regulator [Lachnospiraceae bacterium]